MTPQPQKHVVALLSVFCVLMSLMHITTPKSCNSQILAPCKSARDVPHALELQGLQWDVWWSTRYQEGDKGLCHQVHVVVNFCTRSSMLKVH